MRYCGPRRRDSVSISTNKFVLIQQGLAGTVQALNVESTSSVEGDIVEGMDTLVWALKKSLKVARQRAEADVTQAVMEK